MTKIVIKTDKAPEAIGPYNQGIIVETNKLVFTAGQIPLDLKTGDIIKGDIEIQTKQVIENLKAVLEEAGARLKDVIKTTVFLKNMNDFSDMNRVYEIYFCDNPPARSAVEVARLPKDVLVEIECIAELAS